MSEIMAWFIILPIVIVPVAAEETSSPSHSQVGLFLLQTKRSNVSAMPSENVSNNAATGPEGIQDTHVLAGRAKLNHSFRFSSQPQLLKDGFCRSHPCSLLEQPDHGGVLGATADMSEEGYQTIAKLKSDQEMQTFVVRVIEDYDCHVVDEVSLMGLIPWFSGTAAAQSLAKLEESLLFAVLADGEPWLTYKNSAGTTGADAPLDVAGYMEIAIIGKASEMETFARRLVDHMNVRVTDEGGFKGMLRYLTRAAAFQSFDKLREEIRSAAEAPHSWAAFNSL